MTGTVLRVDVFVERARSNIVPNISWRIVIGEAVLGGAVLGDDCTRTRTPWEMATTVVCNKVP